MQISFFEFFLILNIGQCIFLIFAISYIPKKNTGTNRIIQYLLGIYSFYLLERVIFPQFPSDFLSKYGQITNVFYLLIGPFVYTYIRRLFFYENGKYRLPIYHYLPALAFIVYILFHIYIYDSIDDKRSYGSNLFYTVEILFFISITAYLIMSYRLFIYYKNNELQELSFNPTVTKYIQFTLFCLGLYMAFWLLGIFELFDIVTWIERPLIYDICCLIFGVQIYIVSFYKLKHPEIFKISYPSVEQSEQKKKKTLDAKEVSQIRKLVHFFFEVDKGFCRPDLSLLTLAEELNTTTNKLSWVLNNSYKKTFYELVNEYRVAAFTQKIKENQHKEFTVISLAHDVGFNSKSTFYKAFKEITQMTPTAYIKQVESAHSS